jgi:hypothetical protein
MFGLILIFSVLECYAAPMPAVCTSLALQSQCGGEGCPISMLPNAAEHLVFFYNYSSIQLSYVVSGTSQDSIRTFVMDQQNYRYYLAGQLYSFNYGASEQGVGVAGICKTNVLENTKGIGSVLLVICLSSAGGANCTVWYNQSFTVFVDRCAPNCVTGMAGNGVCDTVCDSAACGYDGADCPVPTQTFICSTGCTSDILGDGYCDTNYDDGDCPFNTTPAPISSSKSKSPTASFPTTQGAVPQTNPAQRYSLFSFSK